MKVSSYVFHMHSYVWHVCKPSINPTCSIKNKPPPKPKPNLPLANPLPNPTQSTHLIQPSSRGLPGFQKVPSNASSIRPTRSEKRIAPKVAQIRRPLIPPIVHISLAPCSRIPTIACVGAPCHFDCARVRQLYTKHG